ncbi:MAG: helix-turn-helix domain-containing protein [Thermogutta sp.]
MLSRHLADKVLQLLHEGKHSQRQIARLTGVSRGTVAAIARGQWHACYRPPLSQDGDTPPPPSRCPDCGAIVTPPCLACFVRRLKSRGELAPLSGEVHGPLQLELHPSHYARYLEVRAAAMARGEGEPSPDWEEKPEEDPWDADTVWPDVLSPWPVGESSEPSISDTASPLHQAFPRRAAR